MNKILAFLLLLSTQLTAIEVLTEAKVGYFLPTDSKFKSIYGDDGIIGGLESSFYGWNYFYPWVSISMYKNSGHIDEIDAKSHAYFIPIGAGLKYIYPIRYHLSVYGAAGVLPTYLHITNDSPLAVHTQSKWGCGGTAKIGFIADRLWNFFIDLFAEYSYIKIPFHSSSGLYEVNPVNMSNFTIGGAVGYHFGGCYRECDDEG